MNETYKIRQLHGRDIQMNDFYIADPCGEDIMFEPDEGYRACEAGFNIMLTCNCDPDEIFFDGFTTVSTNENDDYVNVYVNSNVEGTCIEDVLSVIYWQGDECEEMERKLNRKEKLRIQKIVQDAFMYYLKHQQDKTLNELMQLENLGC